MFHSAKLIGAALLLAAAIPAATLAQDEGLYAAPLPDDAAFVRAIPAAGTPAEAFGMALPKNGDYAVLRADDIEGVEPGQAYSVLPGATILHDPIIDKTKVQIGLFDAGFDGPVSLKTADGKVEIVTAAPGGAGFREVNPIAVTVAVFSDGTQLGAPIDFQLHRGENPAVVVAADGSVAVLMSGLDWEE